MTGFLEKASCASVDGPYLQLGVVHVPRFDAYNGVLEERLPQQRADVVVVDPCWQYSLPKVRRAVPAANNQPTRITLKLTKRLQPDCTRWVSGLALPPNVQ